MRCLLKNTICTLILALSGPAVGQAPALDSEQQEVLSKLNPRLAKAAVELAEQAAVWQGKLERLRNKSESGITRDDLLPLVKTVTADLKARSPRLRQLVGFQQAYSQIKSAGSTARAAQVLEHDILSKLTALREPSSYVRDFARGKLSEWAEQEYEAEGLKFKVVMPDPDTPLFTPDADIKIVVEYPPFEDAKVKASGLYFEYVPGQAVPQAKTDRLQLESNISDIIPSQLSQLGEALPDDLGLGIQIKDVKLLKLDDPAGGNQRGAIAFSVLAKLPEDLMDISLEGSAVVHPFDGTVEWDGELTAESKRTPGVPLGTTGAGMYGFTAGFDPQSAESEISIGTNISSYPGDPDAFALDVELTVPMPLKRIGFEGTLAMGADAVTVGKVSNGVLDFTKGFLKARIEIPGSDSELPIPVAAFGANGDFEVSGEGLFGKNIEVTMYGQSAADAEVALRTDGHGAIMIDGGFMVGGVDIGSQMDASFEPGFQRLQAHAVFEATGLDIGVVKLVDAAVEVDADTENRPLPLHVVARAWGIEASGDLPTFTQLDAVYLVSLLRENAPQLYEQALNELASAEAGVRGALAKAEKDFRREVHNAAKELGMDSVSTGIEEVDQTLGDAADAVKDLGGGLSDMGKDIGGILSGTNDPEIKSVEEIRRERRKKKQKKINQQLKEIITAINEVVVQRQDKAQPYSGPGGKRYSSSSQMTLRFRKATSDLEGDHDAAIALLASVSSLDSKVTSKGPTRQETESDIKSVSVIIEDFAKDDAKPVASIQVPPLKEASDFGARRLAHDKLQELIELHLPEVEIDGNRALYEKQLAVENAAEEDIRVFVQFEQRSVRNKQFTWDWAPSATPLVFRIPAEETVLLTPDKAVSRTGSPGDISAARNNATAQPVRGRAVRIWAESASGRQWTTHEDARLWLVGRGRDNERKYYGEEYLVHTHTFRSRSGPRIWNERIVRVANRTGKPLRVQATALSRQLGSGERWTNAEDIRLAPGQGRTLRKPDDFPLRGRQLKVSAEDEEGNFFRWRGDQSTPLSIVKDDGYKREEIGYYLYIFDEPSADSSDE